MVSRRERTIVVFDTNVFVRGLKSRSIGSPNKRLVRLWLFRLLQLVVCDELIAEYLDTFRTVLGFNDKLLEKWRQQAVHRKPRPRRQSITGDRSGWPRKLPDHKRP